MCLVAGFWLSSRMLHTHEECDMTYSRRQFLPLSMNNNNVTSKNDNNTSQSPSPYRFWKFIDQRDPRYRRFVRSGSDISGKPLMGTDWCDGDPESNSNKNATVAVLYIPGHGGSYEQSRSLGAHGLQLTGARDVLQERRVVSALRRNEWSGATGTDTDNHNNDIDNFTFDVYAVDFGEEAGALHGDLILEQGLFVGQAVQKLVHDCQLQDIVLVGHSMGGFAARLASILVPETKPHIRNIVTLATPHAGAWNPSLFHIHEHMKMKTSTSTSAVDTDSGNDNTVQHNTALISIAGGLRDEMVLPEACYINAEGATTVRTRINTRYAMLHIDCVYTGYHDRSIDRCCLFMWMRLLKRHYLLSLTLYSFLCKCIYPYP
jgi:pimeloyl-ACP methyl ester carboxylesterase